MTLTHPHPIPSMSEQPTERERDLDYEVRAWKIAAYIGLACYIALALFSLFAIKQQKDRADLLEQQLREEIARR